MTEYPLLDHDDIAARIPHAGRMCLLDAVTFWDAQRIVCRATSHLAADHPLRAVDGSLGVAAGIEYAAQAMAVHGHLLAVQAARAAGGLAAKPPPGLLASVRAVTMYVRCLDDVKSPLQVEATQMASDAQALTYAFEVFAVREGKDSGLLGHGQTDGNADGSQSVGNRTSDAAAAPTQPVQPCSPGTAPETPGDRRLLLSGRASVMLVAQPS